MTSFSGLGIGLSFVFGCILLGLVAELYYILWWKKRITNREIDDHYSTIATEVSDIFCWKKQINHVKKANVHQELTCSTVRNTEANNGHHEQDLEQGIGKDLLHKGFGEEDVESELMRLHNLCGPPRFLFTINEETKEDLESEDGKSKKGSRTRSLSDLIIAVDTPFLTPLSSPPIMSHSLDCFSHHGFNPLFESISEAEMNRLRSSPPPKFKFLRDAEEKLMKRLREEAEKRVLKNGDNSCIKSSLNSTMAIDEVKEGSFLSFIGKNKERVLALASSAPTFRPFDKKSGLQHTSM